MLSNDNVWNWGNEGCFSVFDRYIYIYGVSYEPSSTGFASFEKFVHGDFEILVCTFRILTFRLNFLTLIFISFALFNYLFNYFVSDIIYFFSQHYAKVLKYIRRTF